MVKVGQNKKADFTTFFIVKNSEKFCFIKQHTMISKRLNIIRGDAKTNWNLVEESRHLKNASLYTLNWNLGLEGVWVFRQTWNLGLKGSSWSVNSKVSNDL